MIAAAAPVSGRARAAAALAHLKANLKEPAAARAWAAMHETARLLLVGMCTDRPAQFSAALPWGSFSASERDSMGAAARQMQKDFSTAALLR